MYYTLENVELLQYPKFSTMWHIYFDSTCIFVACLNLGVYNFVPRLQHFLILAFAYWTLLEHLREEQLPNNDAAVKLKHGDI